jgi:exodeoxyribonuclease V gamma subunit
MQWRTRLAQALDDLLPARLNDAGDQRAWERLQAQIARFGEQTSDAGLTGDLPPEIVRAWFQQSLAEDDTRQPFLTGGITIARMVPMRLIPFRVICLLGMNDGDYPRRDPVGGLNRLGATLNTPARRIGDRSIRDDDRALFLQLFAAASDCFYISYVGADPRSGEVLPPSVVVAELIDVAAAYFHNAEEVRRNFTLAHPLQPFSAEAFGRGDARRVSYRAGWRPAAERREQAREPLPAFATALPERDMPTSTVVSRDELYRALAHPSRTFLRQRLGLRLDDIAERLPDNEPFASDDALRNHQLSERIFFALAESPALDRDALSARLLAEGWLAPGAAARQEVDDVITGLAASASQWRRWAQGPLSTRPFELALGEWRLAGTLSSITDDGLLQFRAGKAHGKAQLALGLDALIWSALGETRPVHRLIAEAGPQLIAATAQVEARAVLADLLALMRQAQTQALPLMPKTAYAYAHALRAKGDEVSAWRAAADQWSKREGYGEGQDAWVRLALRGNDPFADAQSDAAAQFRRLSRALFDPFLALAARTVSA